MNTFLNRRSAASRKYWFLSLAVVILLSGCNSTRRIDLTEDQNSANRPSARKDDKDPSEDSAPSGISKPFVQVNPNVIIGRIIWVNPDEGTGVIRLDNAYPVEGRYLVAVSPAREPLAVVETLGGLQGQSIGFRILDGTTAPGVDVLLPSRQWALQLRDRYASSGAQSDQRAAGSGTVFGPVEPNDAPVRVQAVPVR